MSKLIQINEMSISIGNHIVDYPIFLAPMAGITDLPFRNVVSHFKTGHFVSEMIASQELLSGRPGTLQKASLGVDTENTSIQISGRDAYTISETAKLVEELGAKIIDINMGCPAKKVVNGYAGSALLKDLRLAAKLIEAVVGAVSIPVTLKTRLGWNDDNLNAPELARIAEQAGIKLITIHARTRCQFYKGAAQLLSMNLETKDRELTDLIVEETRRIVNLLEQVEEFGNSRAPEMAAVNIHDILDRAKRSAQLGFGAHIKFEEEYDPSLPAAVADADQLLQVILNLIKNASEACKDGGKIKLKTSFDHSFRLRRSDGSGQALPLQIQIFDNGPGLPADIRDQVFDPFVSGKENGTGLGLALASKIISDHDGWISVDSIPGNTVFTISLAAIKVKNNFLISEAS